MSGAWVFVCGPSGAGKDSVIAWARQSLHARGDIVFARRMVTRPAQAGSDHDPIGSDSFRDVRRKAGWAWHWQAHGFEYGVPARYARQVGWGRVVVVNGSREHAAGLAGAAGVHRVLVDAPMGQLAARLVERGRDEPQAVDRRLARNEMLSGFDADLAIENDGELATAGARLRNFLETLALAQGEPHARTT